MSATARGGAFFSTMVLMGSSVALSSAAGCGGMTNSDSSGGTTASGGSDGPGTGGSASGGTSVGSGGAFPEHRRQRWTHHHRTARDRRLNERRRPARFRRAPTLATASLISSSAQRRTSTPPCSDTGWHLALPTFCECDTNRPTSRDDCSENRRLRVHGRLGVRDWRTARARRPVQLRVCAGRVRRLLARLLQPLAHCNMLPPIATTPARFRPIWMSASAMRHDSPEVIGFPAPSAIRV